MYSSYIGKVPTTDNSPISGGDLIKQTKVKTVGNCAYDSWA